LIPLKEGTGKLNITGIPSEGSNAKNYKKYYVDVKKVNGELQLTLEETEDVLPTEVSIYHLSEKLQNISLSTMNGEKVSDSVQFEQDERVHQITARFDIDKPGRYIATLQFEGGDEVRYGIDVKQNDAHFYFEIETLKENLSVVYDEGTEADIGKHTIQTNKGVGEVATITRDPGTNLFRIHTTGETEGTMYVDYENRQSYRSCDDTDCYSGTWKGLYVSVKRMGSIVNLDVNKMLDMDH